MLYLLFRKSLQEIHQSDSGEWAASKDLRGHLGHLESELLFLSTLTGINIINYSMKTEDLTSTENTEKSKHFNLEVMLKFTSLHVRDWLSCH